MKTDFEKPFPVQFKPKLWACLLVKLMGWRFVFEGLPTKQGVLIGYPHTSNWDFVVMMPIKWAIGLRIQFFAKDSLFRIPLFGRWIRWLGATPIDRSSPKGVVAESINALKQHKERDEYLWLALSPEGTRKRKEGWKSGFYQLALGADVPLCMLRIDYGKKEARLTGVMRLSGDIEADYAHIARVYEGVRGFNEMQASPICALPSSRSTSAST